MRTSSASHFRRSIASYLHVLTHSEHSCKHGENEGSAAETVLLCTVARRLVSTFIFLFWFLCLCFLLLDLDACCMHQGPHLLREGEGKRFVIFVSCQETHRLAHPDHSDHHLHQLPRDPSTCSSRPTTVTTNGKWHVERSSQRRGRLQEAHQARSRHLILSKAPERALDNILNNNVEWSKYCSRSHPLFETL